MNRQAELLQVVDVPDRQYDEPIQILNRRLSAWLRARERGETLRPVDTSKVRFIPRGEDAGDYTQQGPGDDQVNRETGAPGSAATTTVAPASAGPTHSPPDAQHHPADLPAPPQPDRRRSPRSQPARVSLAPARSRQVMRRASERRAMPAARSRGKGTSRPVRPMRDFDLGAAIRRFIGI